MANDGWGSKWPVSVSWPEFPNKLKPSVEDAAKLKSPEDFNNPDVWINPNLVAWDLGSGDKTVLSKGSHHTELKSQGSNLVDEQAYLYYQCETCNDIFDPHTKSFKTLDEKRFAAGWKVKWNADGIGYKVYCEKCGEKVIV